MTGIEDPARWAVMIKAEVKRQIEELVSNSTFSGELHGQSWTLHLDNYKVTDLDLDIEWE